MANESVKELIRKNRPESVKVSEERVSEILSSMGYVLVPCRVEEHPAKLTTESEPNGRISGFSFEELERAGYKVWRQVDGSFQIFAENSEDATGEYLPIMEAWPFLAAGGYKIFYPYLIDQAQVVPVTKDSWEAERGFSSGEGNSVLLGSVSIWWEGKADGKEIRYTPFIVGGQKLPSDLRVALLSAAGVQEIAVEIDSPIVTMPLPDWFEALEYQSWPDQLPLPEARDKASQFINLLREMGLID